MHCSGLRTRPSPMKCVDEYLACCCFQSVFVCSTFVSNFRPFSISQLVLRCSRVKYCNTENETTMTQRIRNRTWEGREGIGRYFT
jgi:hypothetical protein